MPAFSRPHRGDNDVANPLRRVVNDVANPPPDILYSRLTHLCLHHVLLDDTKPRVVILRGSAPRLSQQSNLAPTRQEVVTDGQGQQDPPRQHERQLPVRSGVTSDRAPSKPPPTMVVRRVVIRGMVVRGVVVFGVIIVHRS